jgi:hypothetical protein
MKWCSRTSLNQKLNKKNHFTVISATAKNLVRLIPNLIFTLKVTYKRMAASLSNIKKHTKTLWM